jgi:Tfp pilus assembly protein FimT
MSGRARGHSLIEALAVAAVAAVLVLIAVPRLVVPETLQVRVVARQLAADLRLAQRLAMTRHVSYVVDLAPSGGPYTTYTLYQAGGAAEPDFPKTITPGVQVTGPPQFVYRPDGSAAAGGAVVLESGGRAATVQVTSATGRVTVTGP